MSDVKIPEGYKQTEVGVIPEDWDSIKVQDVCDFIVPGRNKPQKFDGDIPWITTPDLIDGRAVFFSRSRLKISKEVAKTVGSKIVPAGSVIMSCVGELGLVAIAGVNIVINQQLHAFLPSKKIDNYFLMYALKDQESYFHGAATKTALPYLNKDNCNATPLPLPSIQEQTAIATALSDVDNLIQSLEKLIAKKEAIKTGTMQQLLTGKTRLPEFATHDDGSPKGFKQTELGRIPEDWEVSSLGDLSVQIKSGKNIKDKSGIYPLYGSTGQIGKCKIPSYNQEAILVARVGANAGRVNFVDGKYGVSDNTIIINTNSDNSIQFIKSWLVQKDLNTLVFGSGQPLITGTQLKNLLILSPSKNEQTAIATTLSDMDAEIQTLQQRLAKTKDIKQGMMQQLLTGKVRLVH